MNSSSFNSNVSPFTKSEIAEARATGQKAINTLQKSRDLFEAMNVAGDALDEEQGRQHDAMQRRSELFVKYLLTPTTETAGALIAAEKDCLMASETVRTLVNHARKVQREGYEHSLEVNAQQLVAAKDQMEIIDALIPRPDPVSSQFVN